jgi:hypothetical protein
VKIRLVPSYLLGSATTDRSAELRHFLPIAYFREQDMAEVSARGCASRCGI